MVEIDFTADVEVPTNDELSTISKLAERQLYLERVESRLEDDLKAIQKELTSIRESLLPDAMASVNMTEFRLANGMKLTIKPDVYASIRKDFIGEAVNWLNKAGLGDIVKDKVEVNFSRGSQADVHKLLLFCSEAGFNASENQSVHPMTLKATVKEQLAKGVAFPEEYFSVHPVRKAVIKLK